MVHASDDAADRPATQLGGSRLEAATSPGFPSLRRRLRPVQWAFAHIRHRTLSILRTPMLGDGLMPAPMKGEQMKASMRWLRPAVSAACAGVLVAASLPAFAQDEGTPAAARKGNPNSAYIVQMAEVPVTAYRGEIRGYRATKPNKGQKIDPNHPAVVSYMGYLTSRHDYAMARVGASKKLYSYGYVFNGFAADLTPQQAHDLAAVPGVLAVSKDEARALDTASTPSFLGLSGPTGFWNRTGAKGEGVIIGIVDGGIWPEHPSFSDRTGVNGNGTQDGKLDYHQIPGWNGRCVPGTAFNGSHCNQTLIGARYYNSGWGGNAGITAQLP
ncbi:MAG: S8 family serine peptidase, partial [Aquabacterium sp.]